jgi:pyruvate/2-oxoglutarate dehydrogenase complex dihydrolipoamide dehydrogenase (E3) component
VVVFLYWDLPRVHDRANLVVDRGMILPGAGVAGLLVRVGGTTFEAERGVVIATGTVPSIPPVPGLDGVDYWTNREAIEAKDIPASLVVLGGGTVGLEARPGVRALRDHGDCR